METHEDERRTLIEWITDEPFRSAKVVIAKGEQVIGKHFHKKKDEAFLLLSGKAKKVVIDGIEEWNVLPVRKWFIPRGVKHEFVLEKGSVLLGVGSEAFDPEDEIRD